MSKVYTFNKTTIGHLHVMREIPCEDYSLSYSDENGRYHIAIVADGHGSEECFRSSVGSKAVCEVSLAYLKEFADSIVGSEITEERFYRDVFTNSRYSQMTVRRLTDSIIAGWHDSVCGYHELNPVTEDEWTKLNEKYDPDKVQRITENVEHIYGTTLMAALALPGCLLLIHQGDGRIDVFYRDGRVDQPVPWDVRCEDTATTSMCDTDVTTSIRHKIINLRETPVVACYLGCDGVEDAYRDSHGNLGSTHCFMGGVHTFYKYLTCRLLDASKEEFEQYLEEFLPEFSANGIFTRAGSGDDVSVAGIVDLEAIENLKQQFETDIKLYSLEEELFWKEDELRGKTRKHGILQRRMEDAKAVVDTLSSELQKIVIAQNDLQSKRELLLEQTEKAKAELDQYKQEAEAEAGSFEDEVVSNSLRSHMRLLGLTLQEIYDRIANGVNQLEARYRKLLEKLVEYDANIQNLQNDQVIKSAELDVANQAYADAKANFEEYDDKYRQIESECQTIRQMIGSI